MRKRIGLAVAVFAVMAIAFAVVRMVRCDSSDDQARPLEQHHTSREIVGDEIVEISVADSGYSYQARHVDSDVVLSLTFGEADAPVFHIPDATWPDVFIYGSVEEAHAANPNLVQVTEELPIPEGPDDAGLNLSVNRASILYYRDIDLETTIWISVDDADADGNPEVVLSEINIRSTDLLPPDQPTNRR